jgi:hypothetical protein
MWWRKKHPPANESHDAQHDLALTENLIQQLDSQTAEVDDLVNSLELRRRRNNFGDSLTLAMERRAQ